MEEPENSIIPTSGQIRVPGGLKTMHTNSTRRDECTGCCRRWPCPDWSWAERILSAARGPIGVH